MVKPFMEKIGENLAAKWSQSVWSVIAFWGIVLLLTLTPLDLKRLLMRSISINEGLFYSACAIFLLISSCCIVEYLQTPVLKLLEGYVWLGPFKYIYKIKFKNKIKKKGKIRNEIERIEGILFGNVAVCPKCYTIFDRAVDSEKYAILDYEYVNNLPRNEHMKPTKLGNILKSSEMYSRYRYGLSIQVCWPRLWFLLPEELKKEVTVARAKLDANVRQFILGILFIPWCIISICWFCPLIIAAVVMFISYFKACSNAELYGQFIRTAFDMHRFDLYASLHFHLPKSPKDEVSKGEMINAYLFRGSRSDSNFVDVTLSKKED